MKRLTAKEEEAMEFFWEKGSMFVKDLVQLYPDPKPHVNTASTVVRGLDEKGFLKHRVYGNTYLYEVAITRDEFKKGTLKNVISKYFNNSYLGAVSSLVKAEDLSVDDLKQLIHEVEESNKKK
ncbi:MAG: BlaI/MecI/CopY family transcriptional regulator [Phocaeicola sp.]|uniref:BlaI/MecI/CopY family transcriptional regulator n=1 Tax=Phocaeicola TaxID=909656 RepID=UPI00234E4FB6|nr:BlaI/MecI/CopY family transcriptional regulator [Phocaeicola oris]MCE2616182.1 BlaI/MecI/CopY family transcriptional regulator [Phocaeicola oris]